MSWKGFKKAVTRLPQQVLQKAGYADETYDEEYEAIEGSFKELEASAKTLSDEAVAYVAAVKNLMAEQLHVGQGFQHLMALSPEPPQSEHLAAIEAYVAATTTWTETVAPYVDQTLQSIVVDPAAALVVITKQARGMLDKRGRKVVDYDRTRNALKKAKEKIETTSVDVSKVTKAEIEHEEARREYETLNNRLKIEIPMLMQMRVEFMHPLLEALLSFQIYFFEQGASSLQTLSAHVALTLPIQETYQEKRAPALEFLKGLSLVIPIKLDPSADPSARNDYGGLSPLEEPPAYTDDASRDSKDPYSASSSKDRRATLPPLSSSSAAAAAAASSSSSSSSRASFSAPSPVPRPVPRPAADHVTLAISLYPFHSDTPGDLTFEKDEKINVVQKTDNQLDWWVGRIGDRQGNFPANYVRLL